MKKRNWLIWSNRAPLTDEFAMQLGGQQGSQPFLVHKNLLFSLPGTSKQQQHHHFLKKEEGRRRKRKKRKDDERRKGRRKKKEEGKGRRKKKEDDDDGATRGGGALPPRPTRPSPPGLRLPWPDGRSGRAPRGRSRTGRKKLIDIRASRMQFWYLLFAKNRNLTPSGSSWSTPVAVVCRCWPPSGSSWPPSHGSTSRLAGSWPSPFGLWVRPASPSWPLRSRPATSSWHPCEGKTNNEDF